MSCQLWAKFTWIKHERNFTFHHFPEPWNLWMTNFPFLRVFKNWQSFLLYSVISLKLRELAWMGFNNLELRWNVIPWNAKYCLRAWIFHKREFTDQSSLVKTVFQYLKFMYRISMNFRYGIAHIGRVGSVFMTLSVTLERFFAILYPFKRLHLKTPLLVGSIAFSCFYNVPRFMEFETIVENATKHIDNDTSEYQMVS